ncbi:glycine--tRNA ligase [Candidatus Gottesmanbacteria bacterium]|nr:glycine--tRNA ligase [Candidatus Gottesmanbacteria bacterium]
MATLTDNIISLAKRRGFVFPSSEIYGGIGGFWDYGPLGVELSNNIKAAWWKAMVHDRDDIVGLDSSIIMNPKVWQASGHVTSFTDPLVECKACHQRFRADQPDEITAHETKHHSEGIKDVSWTEPRQFNLLFRTFVGPVEDSSSQAYLRGETCQGIYVNFPNVVNSMRVRVPFGIAQIGKAFRNEVTPGKFLFRCREFEQMELEYFVHPKEADTWFAYWKEERMKWHLSLGLAKEHLRFRQHEPTERAHYAADSWDIEYNYPEWGFKELEGVANRTDYDLKTHGKWSGMDLSYSDPITQEKYIPYIIEPSVSPQRLFIALLIDAYKEEEKRVVLQLHPKLAPVKVAVFPLVANKDNIVGKAKEVYTVLKKKFVTAWDDRGNIGKRYLSQDEIGTPWCVTIDYDTLESDTVTIRDRDTTKQERVNVSKLVEYFSAKLEA